MANKIFIGKRPEECGTPQVAKGRYYICAIIKDEHPYIREWAIHHIKLGFNRIVLYDDGSSRPYDDEIGDLIKFGNIEMRKWSGDQWSRQSRVFNDFVWSGEWEDDDYCAFIDVDEFIFFDDAKNVGEFMKYYAEFAGVGLSWKTYNANGRISAPIGISTPKAYQTEFKHSEPRIKVIGRLKDIVAFPSVHHFIPARGRLVTTNNRTIYGMHTNYCDYTNGHIKHYMTKSWEDWVRRLKRGNITRGLRTVGSFFKFNPDMKYMEKELIKDLEFEQFPTIGKETRVWDGDV